MQNSPETINILNSIAREIESSTLDDEAYIISLHLSLGVLRKRLSLLWPAAIEICNALVAKQPKAMAQLVINEISSIVKTIINDSKDDVDEAITGWFEELGHSSQDKQAFVSSIQGLQFHTLTSALDRIWPSERLRREIEVRKISCSQCATTF